MASTFSSNPAQPALFRNHRGDRLNYLSGGDQESDIALDFGEPQLHLIQPGGIGRREVEPHFRILLQKLLHRP